MQEISVCIHGDVRPRGVKEAISIVNASQSYFLLIETSYAIEFPTRDGRIDPYLAKEIVEEKSQGSKVICVTSMPFTDNWFSHEDRESSIISTFDWEKLYAPPSLRAYLLYQFAQSLLSLIGDLSEEMLLRLTHEPPEACIFDFCSNKTDIRLGMAAGNLCPRCEGLLLQYGICREAVDAVRRIVSLVRDEAIGRPRIIDPEAVFVVMRFSSNDENDNAFQYGIAEGLREVGLIPCRGNDRVQSSQILDQVLRSIQRSRFIVAKVDEDNLNVYFELGVAMGLDKEVLLVSESSLIINLPSDLNNWECLTYNKGNYKQLRDNVGNYFSQTYGLPRRHR